jgi:hypothetical protein
VPFIFARAPPGLSSCITFPNVLFLLWPEVVSILPNHQAEGPAIVGCLLLLVQYICSYSACLEDVLSVFIVYYAYSKGV